MQSNSDTIVGLGYGLWEVWETGHFEKQHLSDRFGLMRANINKECFLVENERNLYVIKKR